MPCVSMARSKILIGLEETKFMYESCLVDFLWKQASRPLPAVWKAVPTTHGRRLVAMRPVHRGFGGLLSGVVNERDATERRNWNHAIT